MGWTGMFHYEVTAKGNVDRKKTLDKEFSRGLYDRYTTIKSAMNGSTYYAAIHDIETGDVFAMVVLTSFRDREFCYKEMTEFCGPIEAKCPKSILELLTDTDDKCANEWRQKCRENLTRGKGLSALPIDAKIRFTTCGGQEYTLIKRSPNYQFKTPWYQIDGEYRYYSKSRIPKDYEVLTA